MPDEESEVPLHKCSECGFLAIREALTLQLLEAPMRYRKRGNVPHSTVRTNMEAADRMPVCFVQKRDFLDSLMAWGTGSTPENLAPEDVVRLLEEDYACADASQSGDGFVRWQQGSTPKEHREMMDRERLLKWQGEREDADKSFRLEMHRDQLKAQRQMLSVQLKASRRLQRQQLNAQDKLDERRLGQEQGFGWKLARFGAGVAVLAALLGAGIGGGVTAVLQKNPTVENNQPINVPATNPIINVQPVIVLPTVTPESR